MKDAKSLVKGRKTIPKEDREKLRRAVIDYIQALNCAVPTELVSSQGDSDAINAAAIADLAGYRVCRVMWQLFGKHFTRSQVSKVVWALLRSVSRPVAEALGLPKRREKVISFFWQFR